MKPAGITSGISRTSAAVCDYCGYSRIGIAPDSRCPECGELPSALIPVRSLLEQYRSAGELYWLRCVGLGLAALFIASFVCLTVALIMPMSSLSLSAINFLGPKVHVVALLQRSVKQEPGPWGVTGTAWALIGLAGVWLITERRSVRGDQESFWSLRRNTRWTAVICVGAALGRLLGYELDPVESTETSRLNLLVSIIGGELPANLLLYLHLRKLARQLNVRRAIKAFDFCAWAVPSVIAAGILMALIEKYALDLPLDGWRCLSAAYGVVAVGVSMIAIGAMCQLIATTFYAGFGNAIGTVERGSRWLSRVLNLCAQSIWNDPARWCASGGLLLWLYGWTWELWGSAWDSGRFGLGGNLPMLNFPGPKVFATPPLVGGYEYYMDSMRGRFGATVVGLIAIWLMTSIGQRWGAARKWAVIARWTATIAVALPMGVALGMPRTLDRDDTQWQVFVATFCEAPATIVLYYYLSRLASAIGIRGKTFVWIAACVPFIVAVPMIPTIFSSRLENWDISLVTGIACAIYGAIAVSVGMISACALGKLMAHIAFAPALRT
jgi:hypothetical protein